MSVFDEWEAVASAAVSDAFADMATHLPRITSQYAESAADPERVELEIEGVFSLASDVNRGMAERTGPKTEFASNNAEFWIEAAKAPCQGLRKGDALSFPDRPGAPVYRIARVDTTDEGDLNCILTIED